MRMENLINYHQLHLFTVIKMDQAARAILSGNKDNARESLRWIRNARIVQILKPVSGHLNIDAFRLDCRLTDLESQCHPMASPPCPTDYLSQILQRLDLIAGFLASGGHAKAVALSAERESETSTGLDLRVSRLLETQGVEIQHQRGGAP